MATFGSYSWDEAAFRTLNLAGSAQATDALMVGLTLASTAYVLGALAVPLGWRGHRERAFDLLVLIVLTLLATEAIKFAIGRPRPCEVLAGVQTIGGFGCDAEFDPAFPSGHTSRAFAVALFAGIHFRWRFGCAAMGFAALAGLSRIYLGVHWPTDAIGGAALGVGMGLLVAFVVARIPAYVRLRARVIDSVARLIRRMRPTSRRGDRGPR